MAHTPGPWTVGERCAQEVRINAPDGDATLGHRRWNELAVVYGCDDMPIEGGRVMEANAALIASAPDLLAGLRDAVEALVRDYPRDSLAAGNWPTVKPLIDRLDAIIAKAENH